MRRSIWLPDRLARRLDGHIAEAEGRAGAAVRWNKVLCEAIEEYLAHRAVERIPEGSTTVAWEQLQLALEQMRLAEAALSRQAAAANRIRRQQGTLLTAVHTSKETK